MSQLISEYTTKILNELNKSSEFKELMKTLDEMGPTKFTVRLIINLIHKFTDDSANKFIIENKHTLESKESKEKNVKIYLGKLILHLHNTFKESDFNKSSPMKFELILETAIPALVNLITVNLNYDKIIDGYDIYHIMIDKIAIKSVQFLITNKDEIFKGFIEILLLLFGMINTQIEYIPPSRKRSRDNNNDSINIEKKQKKEEPKKEEPKKEEPKKEEPKKDEPKAKPKAKPKTKSNKKQPKKKNSNKNKKNDKKKDSDTDSDDE
ncbi:MAG: hypothetical protein Edafosvirus25_6 [Edafosvirus sp.]|uniref:Uncharacterized protein n=1 Tax=Edafosvirus sp. TaxID=2487765 RepID=A0A3G4ZUV5_9VIRU|nr:MAG: hypothetical protein Edafosvirus25_6 [Edafosvirus sp.]